MGWITLDDGQHVFIGSGGKVLATRSTISSAAGGKERGRALAAKDRTGIEPRFRADLAKDIRMMRAGNKELASGINNPPAGTSRQEMIDRVTEKAKAFENTAKIKAKTPVGRGGGEDIKYRAMVRTIKRGFIRKERTFSK